MVFKQKQIRNPLMELETPPLHGEFYLKFPFCLLTPLILHLTIFLLFHIPCLHLHLPHLLPLLLLLLLLLLQHLYLDSSSRDCILLTTGILTPSFKDLKSLFEIFFSAHQVATWSEFYWSQHGSEGGSKS